MSAHWTLPIYTANFQIHIFVSLNEFQICCLEPVEFILVLSNLENSQNIL